MGPLGSLPQALCLHGLCSGLLSHDSSNEEKHLGDQGDKPTWSPSSHSPRSRKEDKETQSKPASWQSSGLCQVWLEKLRQTVAWPAEPRGPTVLVELSSVTQEPFSEGDPQTPPLEPSPADSNSPSVGLWALEAVCNQANEVERRRRRRRRRHGSRLLPAGGVSGGCSPAGLGVRVAAAKPPAPLPPRRNELPESAGHSGPKAEAKKREISEKRHIPGKEETCSRAGSSSLREEVPWSLQQMGEAPVGRTWMHFWEETKYHPLSLAPIQCFLPPEGKFHQPQLLLPIPCNCHSF
ncbi:uncharacterized protein [Symphalangus syndactylus]|uniref:uncharacterized protein n=1 Tax=Symphalangus syndactylus TaxID=9590 RepID=UPI003003E3DF